MGPPWNAAIQSTGRTPALPPSLSADTEGFSRDLLVERNSKIIGSLFPALIKAFNTHLFYPCSLSTSCVSGLVPTARCMTSWNFQSNEGRDCHIKT